MDPLELDLKSNPEHGLRLILTFQPATSFLVPLDRCLSLASQNLFSSTCRAFSPGAPLYPAISILITYACQPFTCS